MKNQTLITFVMALISVTNPSIFNLSPFIGQLLH